MLTPHDLYFLLGILGQQVDAARLAGACLTAARHPESDLPDLLLRQGACDRRCVDQVLAELEACLERHGWQGDAALAELVVSAGRARIMAAWEAVASVLAELEPALQSEERYTGSQLHGQGGLGRVWKADDSRMGRVVALKEVRPELASQPSVMQRFVQEAKITAQLEHPNIMPVYDLQEGGGRTFYTMRFICGQTLQEAVQRFHQGQPDWSSLEFRQLLRVFLVVCDAVSFAHGRAVLHRDLKPANIALGECGAILLFDWGLARPFGKNEDGTPVATGDRLDQTQAGQAVGTPAFMAPEQARGDQELGAATDVYGLGAILFTILTGQPPHVAQAGESTVELLRRIAASPTPLARTRCAQVPRALEAICAWAMAEAPAARYASAADLAREIERWLAGHAVEALPDRWHQRLGRWLWRHPLLTQAAASFLLLIMVTASVIAALAFAARSTLSQLAHAQVEQESRDLEEMFQYRIHALKSSTRFFARLPMVPPLLREQDSPPELRERAVHMMQTIFLLHPEYVLVGLARPDPWTWSIQKTRDPVDAPAVENLPIADPRLQAFFERCAAITPAAVTEMILPGKGDAPSQFWLGMPIRRQDRCVGVAVLAVDLPRLFRLEAQPNPSDRDILVTDAAGRVLAHPSQREGPLTGPITAHYPFLASYYAAPRDYQSFQPRTMPDRIFGCRLLVRKSPTANFTLILVVERPIGLDMAETARTREGLLAFTVVLIVGALIVIYVMLRLLARRPMAAGP